jgi:hypothetical protein
VTRRIDDDEGAPRGPERRFAGVDRDAAVALRLKRIGDEGPFQIDAAPPADLRQRRDPVLGKRSRVVQQAADQRGFPVVDGADDDDPERPRRLLRYI